jgi:hypothetical protein
MRKLAAGPVATVTSALLNDLEEGTLLSLFIEVKEVGSIDFYSPILALPSNIFCKAVWLTRFRG